MSKRPSATNNDPGYLYNQKRLLQLFFLSSAFCGAMLAWMVWDDFDRPWKDEQRAQFVWESERLGLEQSILKARTRDLRAKIGTATSAGKAKIDALQEELAAKHDELKKAEGAWYAADRNYKKQKQFTGEARYFAGHAKSEKERARWQKKLEAETDKEARLLTALQVATRLRGALQDEVKAITSIIDDGIDAVFAEEDDAELRRRELGRLKLLERGIKQKSGYNWLREVPLTDFLAPPTKVEQVVLQQVTDDYEFAAPKRVDRCATCHIGSIRLGFDAAQFPVEILDMEDGNSEKVAKFEEAVYRFVSGIVAGVWPKAEKGPFLFERNRLRDVEIHNETLGILFGDDYDSEEGLIEADEKTGLKFWKRWIKTEDGEWVAATNKGEGTSIADEYLKLLVRMRGRAHWRTHPHFEFMVGDNSPHPYEKVGCSICHAGRGWSTDFGYAWHTPPLKQIDNWMSDEWAAGLEFHHEPLNLPQVATKDGKGKETLSLDRAMAMGAAEGNTPHAGFVGAEEIAKKWKKELGRSKTSLKYWTYPQLPKSLVQASCLKCHHEGLYASPEPEYAHAHLGPPKPGLPDIFDWEIHAKEANDDPALAASGEYDGRLFIPKEPERYQPRNLQRGMNNFIEFGCYGCHKLDEKVYSFMRHVRAKVGPDLDKIATKTTKKWMLKWVEDPKNFRPGTRMPAFWGLSNNSHDFKFRFADSGFENVDGKAWSEQEIYAIVEFLWAQSAARAPEYPIVDVSKGDAARGERIVVGYDDQNLAKACIACHTIPVKTAALKVDFDKLKGWWDQRTRKQYGWGERMARRQGPDLAGIGSKVDAGWLAAWLRDPKAIWHDTNMPNLRLTEQEVLDVVAYLMTLKNDGFDKRNPIALDAGILKKIAYELKVGERSLPTNQDAINAVDRMAENDRALYVGEKLVKHYGCFGCHNVDAFKDTKPIGTELTTWGSKIVDRLEFKHAPIDFHKKDWPYARFQFAFAKLTNPRIYDYGDPRANVPYERLKMPRFGFTTEETKELATFLVGLIDDREVKAAAFRPTERQEKIIAGRALVERFNCQGCHIIEGQGGDVWPAISVPKWQPPDLLGQGIKTQPDWLFKFLLNPYELRPWHSMNMPTFGFTEAQARTLVEYFVILSEAPGPFEIATPDGLTGPDGNPVAYAQAKTITIKDPTDPTKKVQRSVRNALEEAKLMFGEYQCESCHAPEAGVVPEANRAPIFMHTRDGRLRPDWMRLWLYDPGKLQAGTAMPGFFNKGLPQDKQYFDGDADKQVRALIDYLTHHYSNEKR